MDVRDPLRMAYESYVSSISRVARQVDSAQAPLIVAGGVFGGWVAMLSFGDPRTLLMALGAVIAALSIMCFLMLMMPRMVFFLPGPRAVREWMEESGDLNEMVDGLWSDMAEAADGNDAVLSIVSGYRKGGLWLLWVSIVLMVLQVLVYA